MWFKSDISIYQKDDFRYYLKKCRHLGTVWEWLQRTYTIEGNKPFKLSIETRQMFCEDYQVREADLKDCFDFLVNLKLISLDWKGLSLTGRKKGGLDG